MTERQGRVLKIIMAAILLISMFFVAREGAVYVNSLQVPQVKIPCVVIDAGHGSSDPGKVGVNGALEKDINLLISMKLKELLEADGIRVVMTREDDAGLYDKSASNKKVQDMKNRLAVIDKAQPELVVSIHQNSYHEEYVHGAQTFYYTTSVEGRKLAQTIQESMKQLLDPENRREAKANDSYYLLKKTAVPIVIVECGFLTNVKEAEKLSTTTYQDQVARAVHAGIMQYISG